jgi:HTH-type transcriptional regulator/antitoxin MqsA
MRCPVCGEADLVLDTRDLPHTYKGETTIIPAVTAQWCSACGESITDSAETRRVMQAMRAFAKQVNAAIIDPAFILAVRKKLQLSQVEAADLFGGGGVNTFSQYETGNATPPFALIKLLRLLDRHPELLDEIKAA